MTTYPTKTAVERKVKAGAAGAGGGAVLGELINWVLDDYIITPNVTGDLPTPVSMAVVLAAAAVVAFVSGYIAKHAPRPDLPMDKR
jgi:hypothetical protein